MVKAVFAVVLTLLAAANACEQRCFVNQAQSGGNQCTYDCHADQIVFSWKPWRSAKTLRKGHWLWGRHQNVKVPS
ncbi:hypothetical protein X797_002932 [Metarhizium robertsii]|uniref:Uncharacterized protein n=1 Tax=Metarhizium robertsii TaxID=568076 RepID=A0A0A1V4Y3_9HYPO|nr:hypothetical protein X797_002932 [Metarhizium robertsii]